MSSWLSMAKAAVIELNEEERQRLDTLAHARSGKRHETLRAQVILLAARGVPNRQIARQVGLHFNAVGKTRARFAQERLGALQDRPRSGRKPTVPAEVKRRILTEVTRAAARLGPLERAHHGRRPGRLESHRPAALGQK
jgi:Winged helix-turn helix